MWAGGLQSLGHEWEEDKKAEAGIESTSKCLPKKVAEGDVMLLL